MNVKDLINALQSYGSDRTVAVRVITEDGDQENDYDFDEDDDQLVQEGNTIFLVVKE